MTPKAPGLLFSILCFLTLPALAKTPSEILAENQGAVALLTRDDGGLGSGFAYEGHLITNYHVVAGSSRLTVKIGERTVEIFSALAHSPQLDLAVLQLSGGHQSVVLGDSDAVKPGTEVVVIGNPYGLEKTISNGLISGVREHEGVKLFQTSAPISRGNSGGPVFDLEGKVIGVAFASLSEGQNLNFAIPINYVKELIKNPKATRLTSLGGSGYVSTVTVYVTRTGSKYHRDGCQYLRRSRIPLSLEQAVKSYGPCSVCRPPVP